MEEHTIDGIEEHVKGLIEDMRRLSKDEDLRELLVLLRQPGWTTPAEFALVFGLARSMRIQAETLLDSRKTLLDGSRKIALAGAGAPDPAYKRASGGHRF